MVFSKIIKKIFSGSFSKYAAKNRLQMVLTQDRTGLSSNDMEAFRKDLLAVISTYFVIENNQLDIQWDKKDSTTALIINTPVMVRTITGGKMKKAVGAK
jgi:cell division topological specificity factor